MLKWQPRALCRQAEVRGGGRAHSDETPTASFSLLITVSLITGSMFGSGHVSSTRSRTSFVPSSSPSRSSSSSWKSGRAGGASALVVFVALAFFLLEVISFFLGRVTGVAFLFSESSFVVFDLDARHMT